MGEVEVALRALSKLRLAVPSNVGPCYDLRLERVGGVNKSSTDIASANPVLKLISK